MATGLHMALAEDLTVDEYRAVNDNLGQEENPVAGLIFHQAVEQDGRIHVYDVWESRAAFDTFQEQRLVPAIVATVGEERLMAAGPPEIEEYEVLGFVKGAAA